MAIEEKFQFFFIVTLLLLIINTCVFSLPTSLSSTSQQSSSGLPSSKPSTKSIPQFIPAAYDDYSTTQRTVATGTVERRKVIAKNPRQLTIETTSNNNEKKSIVDLGELRFISLDDFKSKCQYFAKIFGLGKQNGGDYNIPAEKILEFINNNNKFNIAQTLEAIGAGGAGTDSTTKTSSGGVIEITRRPPIYIQNKSTYKNSGGGFYVTASRDDVISTSPRPSLSYIISSSSTLPPLINAHFPFISSTETIVSSTTTSSTTPSTTTSTTTPLPTTKSSTITSPLSIDTTSDPLVGPPPSAAAASEPIKIRYTKFEPIILQKTVLTDGRTLYHWHKSLPTSAINLPAPIVPIISQYDYPRVASPDVLKIIDLSSDQLAKSNNDQISTTASTSTTELTPTSSSSSSSGGGWLFNPFSGLFGGGTQQQQTEIDPGTTETTNSVTDGSDNGSDTTKLQHQYKFVIPIHYDDNPAATAPNFKPVDYNVYAHQIGGGKINSPTPPLSIIKNLNVPQQKYNLAYVNNGGGGGISGYDVTPNSGLPYGYGQL